MYMIESLRQLLIQFGRDECGVTTVEYAIMLVLIAIAVAAFCLGLSGSVTSVLSRMISALTQAT